MNICTQNKHLLQQQCLLCLAPSGAHTLCRACDADLPRLGGPACPVCGLPTGLDAICGACLRRPPHFDSTRAVLAYHFPASTLLQRYKYTGFLAAGELMGTLLAERVADAPRPDLLIPMPLHAARLKQRGFNQAVEIARVVARQRQLPLALDVCSRTRPTPPQADLDLAARVNNLRGVFACRDHLAGKRVALLDDVMTSGASLDALAKCVKDAGAIRVDCWVVARTLLKD